MKRKNFVCTFMLTIFIMSISSTIVHADVGPKDQLTVYVKNPPDELYYLDLLTQKTGEYENLSYDERQKLNQDMVELLYSYEKQGWKPALVEGTLVPMWGHLTGELKNGERVHTFGYVGLPKVYRIIIVTKSGIVSVSETLTRKALQSSVTYDYATKKVTVPNMAITYLIQFLFTCIPTLIIEGIILLLFGFSLKDNWKVLLTVNIITQIFLTITIGVGLIKGGTFFAYLIQIPVELVILIAETIAYKKFLKGQSLSRNVFYGVAANIASWVFGVFMLHYQYEFLSNLRF